VKKLNPDVKIHLSQQRRRFAPWLDGPLPEALKRASQICFQERAGLVRGGGTIGAMTALEKVLNVRFCFWDGPCRNTAITRQMKLWIGNKRREDGCVASILKRSKYGKLEEIRI